MDKTKYRSDIDGLRSIAVLSVLLFHLGFSSFGGGFVGVDVFFVISGFLITRLIKDEIDRTGSFDFKNFYLRRIRRLFPALFVTLFVTSALAALLLSPAHLQRFGGALTSALASVSNFYFWFEADYFDVSAQVKPLLHTWSLSIEEQFYLIWPVTIFLLYKPTRKRVAYVGLLLFAVFSLYLNVKFSDGSVAFISQHSESLAGWIADGRATIFFLMPFRVFEFAIGAALVWLVGYQAKSKTIHDMLFVLGLGLIVYAVATFNDQMLFPSTAALVPCLGTALLIYSGASSRFSPLLTNKSSVGIGLLSYSLYLVHWPIIVFWIYLKNEIGFIDQVGMATFSFVLAFLSYRFVECPFRYKKINLGHITWKASSVAAVLIVATVGLHMKISGGWPWRITSLVTFENVSDASEFHKAFYGGAGYPTYGPVKTEVAADIVLMGDSHGRHYAEGLYKELAEPEGKALYVASGSSFIHLPSFVRTTEGNDWEKISSEGMDKAFSYIEKTIEPPLVIVSHFWIFQMQRADLLDEQGSRRNINVDVGVIIQGIRALKQRIGDSPLVVVGQVPTPAGHNLYDIFTRPKPLFFSDFNPDEYLKTPAIEKYIQFNQRLSDAAQSSGEFMFLDPHDVLCEDGICRNTDSQGHLIYSDNAHLSKYGSREVIRAFLPRLKNILQGQLATTTNLKLPEEVNVVN